MCILRASMRVKFKMQKLNHLLLSNLRISLEHHHPIVCALWIFSRMRRWWILYASISFPEMGLSPPKKYAMICLPPKKLMKCRDRTATYTGMEKVRVWYPLIRRKNSVWGRVLYLLQPNSFKITFWVPSTTRPPPNFLKAPRGGKVEGVLDGCAELSKFFLELFLFLSLADKWKCRPQKPSCLYKGEKWEI